MENEQFESVEDLIEHPLFSEWVLDQKHEAFWEQWQTNHPDKIQLIRKAQLYLQRLSFEKKGAPESEVETALAGIWTSINQTEKPEVNTRKEEATFISFRWMRIAASILFLVVAAGLGWQLFSSPYQVYATQFGETRTITLPDQSTVILQANSTLKVLKKWEDHLPRTAELTGEAFFSVRKKQGPQPVKFTVQTQQFEVEVLGTEFNVLDRSDHKRVVLVEGKVRLVVENQPEINLAPNEMAVYSAADKGFETSQVQATDFTAWTEGKLILNNTPLSEIGRMLADNYGLEVRFSEQIEQTQTRTSVGAIPVSSPADLIKYIEASYEVNIQQEGNTIQILK